MIDIRNRHKYTGEEFSQIMTEPEGPRSLASEYLIADFQACSANIQSQISRDRSEGKPFTRPMIPGFYGTHGWTMSSDYKPGGEPTYIISGPVTLGPATLEWGISILKCQFTDLVVIKDLSSNVGLRFSKCFFKQGIQFENLETPLLHFSEIDELLDISIDNSKIEVLNLSKIRAVVPIIHNTQVGHLEISDISMI